MNKVSKSKGAIVEIWTWRSYSVLHFIIGVITSPCWDENWSMLVKRASVYDTLLRLDHYRCDHGGVSLYKYRLTGIGILMLKIKRSGDRLIFNMGIPILGKDGLYIETGPWLPYIIWTNITGQRVVLPPTCLSFRFLHLSSVWLLPENQSSPH